MALEANKVVSISYILKDEMVKWLIRLLRNSHLFS